MQKNSKRRVKIIGIGGGVSNIINRIKNEDLPVDGYVLIDTDENTLVFSKVDTTLQIKETVCKECDFGITEEINGCDLLVILSCLGGSTGTSTASVVADIARTKNIPTVAIVTMPFGLEGIVRKKVAENGIEKLKAFPEKLIVISNDECKAAAKSFEKAFELADQTIVQEIRNLL